MHDERGDSDRRQEWAYLYRRVVAQQGSRQPGARGHPEVPAVPRERVVVTSEPRVDDLRTGAVTPRLVDCLEDHVEELTRPRPRALVVRDYDDRGREQDQRCHTIRVKRSEARARGRALGRPKQHGTLEPHRVEHGTNVVDAVVHREVTDDRIRQASPAPIEQHQPGERRNTLVEPSRRWVIPRHLDVAHEAVGVHDVRWPVTHDLIRDRHPVVGLGVPDLRYRAATQPPAQSARHNGGSKLRG